MYDESFVRQAGQLLGRCRRAGLMLATAESCTGGLIAACLTEVPGSSSVLERGFVTYSNEAKQDLLAVPPTLLEERGAVSAEVAAAMAEGALSHARADLALAVTGIAGPSGATPSKPIGLVYLGLAFEGRKTRVDKRIFAGGRTAVRLASLRHAFTLLDEALASSPLK